MSLSYFESRHGKVSCSAKEVFAFASDLRNFEQFIPKDTISNWRATAEECTFSVAMLGSVAVRIEGKEQYSKIVYNGDALKKNDFSLTLHLAGDDNDNSIVQVILSADLNPMMKMMAVKPIEKFLQKLITEMEIFRGWNTTTE